MLKRRPICQWYVWRILTSLQVVTFWIWWCNGSKNFLMFSESCNFYCKLRLLIWCMELDEKLGSMQCLQMYSLKCSRNLHIVKEYRRCMKRFSTPLTHLLAKIWQSKFSASRFIWDGEGEDCRGRTRKSLTLHARACLEYNSLRDCSSSSLM